MASEATGVAGLAERYAIALFELADEQKALDAVAADLRALRALLQESADLRRMVRSPVIARAAQGKALARNNINAWSAELARGLDAVVVNASGCGTTVKDYGHFVGGEQAQRIGALTRDVTELLAQLGLKAGNALAYRVAYHDACSLQHGQRVTAAPRRSR